MPLFLLFTPFSVVSLLRDFIIKIKGSSLFQCHLHTLKSIFLGCSDNQVIEVTDTGIIEITSPGYPENYTNNDKSCWSLKAPEGERVSMTILDIDTEHGYDILKILDGYGGKNKKVPILATMSGNEAQGTQEAVVSRKEKMRITFTSDANINKKGFKATVTAIKKIGKKEKCYGDNYVHL